MMRALAIDTWAFVELHDDTPRAPVVADSLRDADVLLTTRDVVAESCNFIIRRSRRTEEGLAWWRDLLASPVRIVDPPLAEVRGFMEEHGNGGLSFTDHSLAYVALREHCTRIATEDREFRRFGLEPIFARPRR